jgi:hypothetical protein
MDETTKFTSRVSWATTFCVKKTTLFCGVGFIFVYDSSKINYNL